MAKGDLLFWVAPVEKAAKQIWTAIVKKRKAVYVSKRWFLVALLFKIAPNWLVNRL
jgi:cbb3-type cytochrome oxidase subunit 1